MIARRRSLASRTLRQLPARAREGAVISATAFNLIAFASEVRARQGCCCVVHGRRHGFDRDHGPSPLAAQPRSVAEQAAHGLAQPRADPKGEAGRERGNDRMLLMRLEPALNVLPQVLPEGKSHLSFAPGR